MQLGTKTIARQRQIFYERYNSVVDKTIALENAASDYEKAMRIRAYINAVESSFGTERIDQETAAWINWANDKADWYDPIRAREDEYFGKRRHADDESRKILKKTGYYW